MDENFGEGAIIDVVSIEWFKNTGMETPNQYSSPAINYIKKKFIMTASNACAVELIEKWTGRVRNAGLNMTENCQIIFMHKVVLEP